MGKTTRGATDAQKIALEKQLVKEGKIYPRTRYAPRSFAGRVLAVLLAFLIGIFTALGGLLGAGFFMGTRPLRDVLGMLNIDYSEFLTESAADLSALQLVQDLAGGGLESLDDVAEYTPYVDTLIEQVNTQLAALGVTLDSEEFKATPFTQIGEYFADTIQTAELGKAMGVTAQSDPLMLALCYGTQGSNEEGGDYTVDGDGNIVMNEGKSPTTIATLTEDASGVLGKVTVEAALDVSASSNSAMRYLAYGTEGETYRIVTGEDGSPSVEMLTDPMTGERYRKKMLNDLTGTENVMGDATIADVITITDSTSGLLYAIRHWTVDDLGNQARLERLRLDEIITIDENSSSVLRAMANWRISDMTDQEKVDSLTLRDVINVSGSALLGALADTRLGELSQATQELRLSDILDQSAFADNRLLESLAGSSLSTLADDVKNLTVAQVYGDQIYSYLDLGEDGDGTTYADYIKNYKPDDETGQSGIVRPIPVSGYDAGSFSVREERRLLGADGTPTQTQVLQGWFRTTADGEAIPVDEAQVRRITVTDTEGASQIRTFVRVEVSLTPAGYTWSYVDYSADGALTALPAGTSIGTDLTGYTPEENGTGETHVTDESGAPLYYLTERTAPAQEGETTVQQVAYPVLEDGNGMFVLARTLDEGAQYSRVTRIDLERTVTAYEYEDGTPALLDGDGNVLYGEEQQPLPVRTRTADGETQYFVTAQEDALQRYYYGEEGSYTFPDEAETQVLYLASWTVTESDGSVQTVTDRPVDRFLDGIWYVMFGGEDESGAPVDRLNVPILDIAPEIGAAADVINTMPLWKLWLHGIIGENPFQPITYSEQTGEGETIAYTNLNQLTVSGVIRYIKFIAP